MTPRKVRCPSCGWVPNGIEWDGMFDRGWRLKVGRRWHQPEGKVAWRRDDKVHHHNIYSDAAKSGAIFIDDQMYLPYDAAIACTRCGAEWTPTP